MKTEILMPPLSQTSDTLTLLQWLKNIGDFVKKGEPLYTVETDKAILEVEAPADGFLVELLFKPNEEVKVGTVIGFITHENLQDIAINNTNIKTTSENLPERVTPPSEGHKELTVDSTKLGDDYQPSDKHHQKVNKRLERVFISPRAKKLIQEKDLSIDNLLGKGSGVNGAIVERDVRKYLELQTSNQTELNKIQPAAISHVWHNLIVNQTATHQAVNSFCYYRFVDATELVKVRKRIIEKCSPNDVQPSLTDFYIAMLCKALSHFPMFNSVYDGNTFVQKEQIHLSLSVGVENGEFFVGLPQVEKNRISNIAAQRVSVMNKINEKNNTSSSAYYGTFTLIELSAYGVELFTPSINFPQAASLGIGKIHDAVKVVNNEICIRKQVGLSFCCHPLVNDNVLAAKFLDDISTLIETPELLLY